jgi:hypothetical protein
MGERKGENCSEFCCSDARDCDELGPYVKRPPPAEPPGQVVVPSASLKRDPSIPRRAFMPEWCAAERAIFDAVQLVEQMGADVRLTDAVILLGKARERVADYIDGVTP